jgi:hypothetical protein
MTAALTPTLALQYLAELDPAIVAVAVVRPDGATLAGDPSLSVRLAAGSGGEQGLLIARSSAHVVIARVGAGALEALVRHDLEMVARELG